MQLIVLQAQRPVQTIQQLSESIQTILEEDHVAGAIVGITTKDSILFSGGLGYADILAKRKPTNQTLFRMGSITKMFVALGIIQLVEEGKLKLADKLRDIAPEVPFTNKWEKTHPVRIVDLLEQTTGFDDVKLHSMYDFSKRKYKGLDAVLVQKSCLVARWRPSERHAYSNPNYAILGYIIEKITGKPYDLYLSETILKPLGMTSANFNPFSQFPERETKEYLYKNGKFQETPVVTLKSGAVGALWASSDEMLRFVQLFLQDGQPLFSSKWIDRMETPTVALDAKAGLSFGYGLANQPNFLYQNQPFRGHNGRMGNVLSSFFYNRELGVGFVISTNSNYNNHRIENLISSYLQKNAPRKIVKIQPLDRKAIEPFLGYYEFRNSRNEIGAFKDRLLGLVKIYTKGDKLFFKPLLGAPFELKATSPTTFTGNDMNMEIAAFTQNHGGKLVVVAFTQYHEKVNGTLAIFQRIVVLLAALLVVSSIFMGGAALFLVVFKYIKWEDALPRIVPALGVILLFVAVFNLLEAQTATYLLAYLATPSPMALTIFFGTLAFGISTFVSLYFAYWLLSNNQNRWYSGYYVFMSLSMLLIFIILWQNGWIGLRTWG